MKFSIISKGAFLFLLLFLAGGCSLTRNNRAGHASVSKVDIENVELADLTGKPIKLSDIVVDGNPVYIAFFASWCKICSQEVPENNRIFETYGASGLKVYGVNVGDDWEIIQKFIGKYEIKYPVLVDLHTLVSQDHFMLVGLPLIVIIDTEGNVLYRDTVPPPDEVIINVIESNKETES